MSLDSVKETYINECNDLLQEMEFSLLSLEDAPQDQELINSIFRSAHTIKGTSGVFGYDDVVSFTHGVEGLLDRVRKGEVGINQNLIALMLESNDHIKALIDVAIDEESEIKGVTASQGDRLTKRIKEFFQSKCDHIVLADSNQPMSCNNCVSSAVCNREEKIGGNGMVEVVDEEMVEDIHPSDHKVESGNWHISLRFSPDVLREGMDPLSFLHYLEKVGEVVTVNTVYESLPSLDDFDAESCYLGIEIDLKSDETKERIESVFEFILDESTVHILSPYAMVSQYSEIIDSLPEDNMMLGEMLIKSGSLTRKELNNAITIQRELRAGSDSADSVHRLGDILVENKSVHKETIDDAVSKQKKTAINSKTRSIRIDSDKLDSQINLVGELVIAGARSNLLAQQIGNDNLLESISVIGRLVEEIRDSALRMRMVQIGDTFRKFQRVVRDVGRELNKDINLEISGAETELDKTVIEKIGDPLMHLVRNAIDHGIESPEDRVSAGKPSQGNLSLHAFHDSGNIVIKVSDDGKGLDKQRIISKAIENSLIEDAHGLSDNEIYQLIFEPGFSTAKEVSNLSGRGVGMDVVKKNIISLRGNVEIDTEAGMGTTISISLPLTLAIIDGFLVGVSDCSYVIPLDMVIECIEVTEETTLMNDDSNYINLRGEVLPYIRLSNMFGENNDDARRENIVVVEFGEMRAGLVVDELRGEFQTVIKPLGKVFETLSCVSGSTILGSGEVAVILDVPGLIKYVTTKHSKRQGNAVSDTQVILH